MIGYEIAIIIAFIPFWICFGIYCYMMYEDKKHWDEIDRRLGRK